MTEIGIVDRYDQIRRVSELYIKGTTAPTTIARELGIKRAEALSLIDEWKDIARNDTDIRQQALDSLNDAVQHYSLLIEKGWSTMKAAENSDDLKTVATLIKAIADIDGKRVDMLQKAGLYDDASLGDELAEMEEKQQILIGILKEVSGNCEKCKYEVARRLTKVTGNVESVSPNAIISGEVSNPAT